VHEGGWTVRFLEHYDVIANAPNGNVISNTVDPPDRARSTIGDATRAAGVAIDPTTITPRWWNDPLRLGDVIGGLAWHDERADRAAAGSES
jgi:hypothetical protein